MNHDDQVFIDKRKAFPESFSEKTWKGVHGSEKKARAEGGKGRRSGVGNFPPNDFQNSARK